ncbi:GNAT family N-acetyltransferase [Lacrimispora algidixylanolytica]|uniref:Alanine acetyltransferase n=1 Tax=Lacrimispora algidixylanolytica TaxID=94868 RepID=A0A419T7Y1_9FIRM|nr:GNAT family N-acetyltransferase [Lacrimispora algidixylanolytica]RKD33664.1 alanine acetyltransferase [Lacrimispora algidixylanolytica]
MKITYETERLILRTSDISLTDMVLDYHVRNQAFLKEWEPIRSKAFYSRTYQEEELMGDSCNKNALRLWISKKENPERIIGCIGFTNIIKGAFQSCYLGYKLDEEEINKGYMTEALRQGIQVIWKDFGLHRIEANIMPRNNRSIKVTEKLGFSNEGLSPRYLNINGVWEDHIHMVLLNDRIV